MIFAVTLTRGGPWDWTCGLREQAGFDEHARFVDALVDGMLTVTSVRSWTVLLDGLGATDPEAPRR